MLPVTRWLYDYSRENFARQERLNFVLMACVQQLAVENARLVGARRGARAGSVAGGRLLRDRPRVKLACVVQRYGAEVTGGAEAHCRAVAERLAETHDVTVLTSCAKDYLTWRNAYPPGESRLGPVTVLRFPVTSPRHLHRFADLSHEVFGRRSTTEQQHAWFEENGPTVPALLDHLRDRRARSTTSCCSGRTATTRASSGCRSSATGPSSCRRPRRIRRSGSTCSATTSRCLPVTCS